MKILAVEYCQARCSLWPSLFTNSLLGCLRWIARRFEESMWNNEFASAGHETSPWWLVKEGHVSSTPGESPFSVLWDEHRWKIDGNDKENVFDRPPRRVKRWARWSDTLITRFLRSNRSYMTTQALLGVICHDPMPFRGFCKLLGDWSKYDCKNVGGIVRQTLQEFKRSIVFLSEIIEL